MNSTKLIIILVVIGAMGIGALYFFNSISSGSGGLLGGLLGGLVPDLGGLIPDSISGPLENIIGSGLSMGLNNVNQGLKTTEALIRGDIGGAVTSLPIVGGIIGSIF